MSNKAKRNIFLGLLIAVGAGYILLTIFKNKFDVDVKWWIFSATAIVLAVLWGGYRNFSQAVKEDRKYGPIKRKNIT